MTSNFSNDGLVASDSIFKKHHVTETVNSLAESKLLADGYTHVNKWQHRAHVVVVGDPTIRPYDPIYLDGLPNGMSGYWTVLSVVHKFGGSLANYLIELEVGTDLLGDTDPNAANNADVRDLQAEIAGQALIESDTVIVDTMLSPNSSSLSQSTGTVPSTAITSSSAIAVPNITGATPYIVSSPNVAAVKPVTRYAAKKPGTLLI